MKGVVSSEGVVRAGVASLVATAMALGTGCASAPPPLAPALPPLTIAAPANAATSARMIIETSPDTNPDASGRASPVVVRVYQLRTDASFRAAEFFPLFDDDEAVLGEGLLSRDEYVLAPSESKTIEVSVSPETRFVGAIAAFRSIRDAQWRSIVAASPGGGLRISVERARIALSVLE